jgi:hypothetical protein
MFWTDSFEATRGESNQWTDQNGRFRGDLIIDARTTARPVNVCLTIAHLDHNPENNSDENLRALCQWCHLDYDREHHAETRAIRKDRGRPILQLAGESGA